ncbi:MAG: hypothetical protein ACHQF2_02380 [Flavobacteriales bacterium]
MVNVLKSSRITVFCIGLFAIIIQKPATGQSLEIKVPGGSIVFQLIDNQKSITEYLVGEMRSNGSDSVTLTGGIPGYMLSVLPPVKPLPVEDSVRLSPTGPHYRGVLTVPIEVDLRGKRILRFDRMMVVHGKAYTAADVKTLHTAYTNQLKKDLFIRLCDTVIKYRYTPLPDSLKDRYGRADRKKMKRLMEPLLDSLSRVYPVPDLTEQEIRAYEIQSGLPAMDGKYLVIATLKEGEDVLNSIMSSQVNKTTRAYWRKVTE